MATPKGSKVYILKAVETGEIAGAWSNLRSLCDGLRGQGFPSYWTVVRQKADRDAGVIPVRWRDGDYQIVITLVH